MQPNKENEINNDNTQTSINIEEPNLQAKNEEESKNSNKYNNDEKKSENQSSNNGNKNTIQNEEVENKQQVNTTKKKENIPCSKKYSFCFCKINCSFFVNFCDQKEREEYCNNRSKNCFFIIVCLYYYILLFTECIYFLYILCFKFLSCVFCCLDGYCGRISKANDKAIKEMQEKSRRFDVQYNKEAIEDLKKERDNMDRTIYLNALDDPEYQARVIDYKDAQYEKEIKRLEGNYEKAIKELEGNN
jgi:hypothetical protein